MHVTVYGPFFFMEMTITSTVYLDMLQHYLIPKLDEDYHEGLIHFQLDGAPLISLRSLRVPQHPFPRSVDWSSCAESMATSFPLILHPWIFSYGDLLKIECSYQMQMSLSSEIELLAQLQE
jgi:hypothetical protein